ncbi:hypothetical protein [Mycobacterium hubeiense]|uniref:hypothetical protein n=1 Tax=Mycobacterium hubeiense TaxID=1867256 RepID=UPI001159013F|nr:hypothetical protein [Mycobacterium sp. QGD 101]
MATDLGGGEVTIGGETHRWDSITLLDNGVLRLARLETWADEKTGLRCAADKTVEYHAPGVWTSIAADVPTTGTLIVDSDIYGVEVLGTSLTEQQAIQHAIRHLTNNYQADDWHADHVHEFFRENHSHQLMTGNYTDRPRFRWAIR